MPRIPRGKIALVVLIIAMVVVAYVFSTQLLSNVHKGYYEVRQSWITGQVSAKMTPGWWIKVGDITQWPKAETYYFTKGADSKFDTRDDHSIVVQFNEGPECNIPDLPGHPSEDRERSGCPYGGTRLSELGRSCSTSLYSLRCAKR